MPQKYISPFSGKKITPQQFLAGVAIHNKELSGAPMSDKDKKGQYIAAAKIYRKFKDEFDDVIKLVAEMSIKNLFPLVYNNFMPLKRKLDKRDKKNRVVKQRKSSGPYLGGEIEKL